MSAFRIKNHGDKGVGGVFYSFLCLKFLKCGVYDMEENDQNAL